METQQYLLNVGEQTSKLKRAGTSDTSLVLMSSKHVCLLINVYV